MSETPRSSREPTEAEIAKGLAYLRSRHGGEWRPVEPIQVFVRRTSGRIDGDWFAVAYDTQYDRYAVHKADGSLKSLPSAELRSLNKHTALPESPLAEKPRTVEKAALLIGGTRDAVAGLGLDEDLQEGFIEKMHLVADVIATELDGSRPEVGLACLEDVSMATGGKIDLNMPEAFKSLFNPLNAAVLQGSFEKVFAAARPCLEAILSQEMFWGMVVAIRRSPALGRELDLMVLAAILTKAYHRKKGSV